MRRIVLVSFVLFISLFANAKFELSLYERIFPLIFEKNIVRVFGEKKDINLFKNSKKFVIVKDCKNSDFIFGNIMDYEEACQIIPKFVKSYKIYKKNDNVFGAFYWRKGRPQLKFKKNIMKKFNLNIPSIIKEYLQ